MEAWQHWNYKSFTTDDWIDIWGPGSPGSEFPSKSRTQFKPKASDEFTPDDDDDDNDRNDDNGSSFSGPRNRMGHSMVVWRDKVILFGGRDNEIHRPHIPKTYDLDRDDKEREKSEHEYEHEHGPGDRTGEEMFFKPLLPGYDPTCQPVTRCVGLANASSGNNESCSYSWHHILEEHKHNHKYSNSDSDSNNSNNSNEYRKSEIEIEEACGFAPTTQFYNDVWIYDLECERRYADMPCEDDGWRVLHPGKRYGGCRDKDDLESDHDGDYNKDKVNANANSNANANANVNVELGPEDRVCDIPSERWGHGAAMIDEDTMVVYGGSSQECEDYCDDVWAFDFKTMEWERVDPQVQNVDPSVQDGDPGFNGDNANVNINKNEHPGKRWKFSMVSTLGQNGNGTHTNTASSNKGGDGFEYQYNNGNDNDSDNDNPTIIIFGGHRLWHGFSDENSQENRWNSTGTYPEGGFLNDLWFLTKHKVSTISNSSGDDAAVETETSKGGNKNEAEDKETVQWEWKWKKQQPKETCIKTPGIRWEDRNNVRCQVYWPRKRSGHAAAYDEERKRLWIHGGYNVHYPYPSSSSSGSGKGVKGLREKGFIPYASSRNAYYLDDLWFYDIETGIWTKIRPSKLTFRKVSLHYCVFLINLICTFRIHHISSLL